MNHTYTTIVRCLSQLKSTLILILCFYGIDTSAQCPTGIVTLKTQAQVDQFIIDYPNCTELDRLDITLGTDIVNVNALNKLERINGQLNITHNPLLNNLSGLSNIKHVAGNFWIADNSALTSINTFNNLEFAGHLYIGFHGQLVNIEGFNALTNCGGITLEENTSLTTINNFNALASTGSLNVNKNPVLTNLNGFNVLTSVSNSLYIAENGEITNLDGFNNISQFGGAINIQTNIKLTSISGIQNINPSAISGSGLTIVNNALLSVCDLPNICTYLQGAGPRTISGNAGDCITEQAVIDACNEPAEGCLVITSAFPQWPTATFTPQCIGAQERIDEECETGEYSKVQLTAGSEYTFSSSVGTDYVTISDEDGEVVFAYGTSSVTWTPNANQIVRFYLHLDDQCASSTDRRARIVQCSTVAPDCPPGDVDLTSQAEVDQFLVDYPNCTEIAGRLLIGEGGGSLPSNITNVSPLTNITKVNGTLYIQNNGVLQNLNGLNISNVAGGVFIGGDNTSNSNAQLQNLNGLSKLSGIGGDLNIQFNNKLANLSGLSGLATVGGLFNITGNASLTNFNGMNNLSSIGGHFFAKSNASLANFNGLNKLSNISGNVYIYDNGLTSVDGLSGLVNIGGVFELDSNLVLTNLNGLQNLKTVGNDIAIHNNIMLQNISGLSGIDMTTMNPVHGAGLYLKDNTTLPVCNLPNFCTYLANPAATHPRTISGNAADCITEQAVIDACNDVDLPGDECANAIPINTLFGHPIGEPQASGTYSTEGMNNLGDPAFGHECFNENNTIWFTFTGDGDRYEILSKDCSAFAFTDPNGALYDGTCGSLSAIDCHSDISESEENPDNNFRLIFPTEVGKTYYLLVEASSLHDGEDYNFGEFCLEVTRLSEECLVNIPDPNFKNYLLGNFEINKNGDGEIQCEEAEGYFGDIDCSGLEIADLTGIEAFIYISYLNCSDNNLTSLDLSQNNELSQLNCSGNNLNTLKLVENRFMWLLNCSGNRLGNVDISKNPSLQVVDVSNNRLAAFDISGNDKIISLSCNGNLLVRLNLANGNNEALQTIHAQDNPNLTCIQVDDASYSIDSWTGANYTFDDQHEFNEQCAPCENTGFVINTSFLTASRACVGDLIHFIEYSEVSDSTGISFHWDFGNGVTSSDRDPVVAFAPAGEYVVTLTVHVPDCNPVKLIKNVSAFDCLKKADRKETYSRVYPTPTNGPLTLSAALPEKSDISVTVFDFSGREVYARYFQDSKELNQPLEGLTKGLYIVEFRYQGGAERHKVLVLEKM